MAEYKDGVIEILSSPSGAGKTTLVKKISLRKNLYDFYKSRGYSFVSELHPSAIISQSSKVSEAVNIMAGCIIKSNTEIYENSIINTGVKIDHDCIIG